MANNAKLGLEESIIKICVNDRKIGSEVACQLRPEVFEDEVNRKIFISYKESVLDEKIALDDVAFLSSIDDLKCRNYAQDILTNNQGVEANYKLYVDSLLEKFNKRRIKKIMETARNECDKDTPISEILALVADESIKISSNSKEYEIEDMGKIFASIEQEIGTEAGLSNLVDLGLEELTEFIGKVGLGSVMGIAARPSMGKTALVVEMLKQLSIDSDKASLVFSLETDRRRFTHRLIANASGVPLSKLKDPLISQVEKDAIKAVRDKILNSKIRFADVFDTSIEQICSVARKEKLRNPGLQFIFIDYLQLVTAEGKGSRHEEVSHVSRKLKILAKELNVVIVEVLQLNRMLENRPDKRPALSDIRECVTGDTLVYMADGSRVPIKDLDGKENLDILSLNNETMKIVTDKAKVYSVGPKEVYEITTTSGRKFKCTNNHMLKTFNNWKELGSIDIENEYIAIPRVLPINNVFDNTKWNDNKLILAAHLIGDGCTTKRISYCSSDRNNLDFVKNAAIKEFGCKVTETSTSKFCKDLNITNGGDRWHKPAIRIWLESINLYKKNAYTKRIPEDVFKMPENKIWLFINHLWSTDGHFSLIGRTNYIGYSSNNYNLILDLKDLLLKVGVLSRINTCKKAGCNNTYVLTITGKRNIMIFSANFIDITGRKANPRTIFDISSKLKDDTNVDIIPKDIFPIVENLAKDNKTNLSALCKKMGLARQTSRFKINFSRDRLWSIGDIFNSNILKTICDSDIFWDRIKSVILIGVEDCYDITVDTNANFIADGVFAHNSGGLEQDLDLCLMLYREEYYHPETNFKDIVEIIVAKNKEGPLGTIRMKVNLPCNQFLPLSQYDI